jgi:hypothetical protein
MRTLSFLQTNCNTRVAIASMARKNYVHRVLQGLEEHCTSSGRVKGIPARDCFPRLACVLTREDWPMNTDSESRTRAKLKVMLHDMNQMGPKKLSKKWRRHSRYKSISKIAHALRLATKEEIRNILIIDDDLGYFRPQDRISGQIFEIVIWNGPRHYMNPSIVPHAHRHSIPSLYSRSPSISSKSRSPRHRRQLSSIANTDITLNPKDEELKKLVSAIKQIFLHDNHGSLRYYLASRMRRVFECQYRMKSRAMKLRKQLITILRSKNIGMDLDERTAISSLWIFDNILKYLSNGDAQQAHNIPLECQIETFFGCIIIYHMYIYNKYPSPHFYSYNFERIEFWNAVMAAFFDHYARLYVLYLNAGQNQNQNQNAQSLPPNQEKDGKKAKKTKKPLFKKLLKNKRGNSAQKKIAAIGDIFALAPGAKFNRDPPQIVQSESTEPIVRSQSPPAIALSGTTEISVHSPASAGADGNRDSEQTQKTGFYLAPADVIAVQSRFKTLIQTISKNVFSKNFSSSCFVGCHLLGSPVSDEYQAVLRQIYRSTNGQLRSRRRQ